MARADDRLGIYERLGFAIIIGWRLRILHERDEKKKCFLIQNTFQSLHVSCRGEPWTLVLFLLGRKAREEKIKMLEIVLKRFLDLFPQRNAEWVVKYERRLVKLTLCFPQLFCARYLIIFRFRSHPERMARKHSPIRKKLSRCFHFSSLARSHARFYISIVLDPLRVPETETVFG